MDLGQRCSGWARGVEVSQVSYAIRRGWVLLWVLAGWEVGTGR